MVASSKRIATAIRSSVCLKFHQLMNGEIGDGNNRPLKAHVQRLFFRRLQEGQPQRVPLHIAGDGFEQRLVMADPSADRRRIKQVGAVVAIDHQPVVFGHDIEKQIEIDKPLWVGIARDRTAPRNEDFARAVPN